MCRIEFLLEDSKWLNSESEDVMLIGYLTQGFILMAHELDVIVGNPSCPRFVVTIYELKSGYPTPRPFT